VTTQTNAGTIHTDPTKRHEFVLLFDVTDGNPNGDPDAGNLPRVDPETMQGLVTDVAIKRKVRDFVAEVREGLPGYEIYVKHRGILAREQSRAYQAKNAPPSLRPNEDAKSWMCQNFYDIRMFGAVMTTGDSGQKDRSGRSLQWNCGQVRGPVQLKFARSIDPITPLDCTLTRVALTNPEDVARAEEAGGDDEKAISGQMGRKAIVPYALYRAHGYFSPKYARDTGVSSEDMELLWRALVEIWEHDRSAARGEMVCRGLYIFTHENAYGSQPAHKLFESVQVPARNGSAPRAFSDYNVGAPEAGPLDRYGLPGVTLTRLGG
jgi:CRISPR-associated protein Csd2